jgi:hypothetical protein
LSLPSCALASGCAEKREMNTRGKSAAMKDSTSKLYPHNTTATLSATQISDNAKSSLKSLHVCPTCYRTFSTVSTLERHYLKNHTPLGNINMSGGPIIPTPTPAPVPYNPYCYNGPPPSQHPSSGPNGFGGLPPITGDSSSMKLYNNLQQNIPQFIPDLRVGNENGAHLPNNFHSSSQLCSTTLSLPKV